MQVPDYQRQADWADLPPARRQIEANADDFMSADQAGLAQYGGEAAQRLDHAAAELYSQQLQEANAARVADARNATQARVNDLLYGEQGVLRRQGAAAFEPDADGKPASAGVLEAVDAHVSETAAGLGNEAQRREYALWAEQLKQQTAGLLRQHEGQQFRVYRRGVAQAALAVQKQTMGLNYNNMDLLEQGADAMRQAGVDLARLEGAPDGLGAAEGDRAASEGLHAALSLASQQGDADSVSEILQRFGARLAPEHVLDGRRQLAELRADRAAGAVANQVMAELEPRFQTGDFARMRGLALADAEAKPERLAEHGAQAAAEAGQVWDRSLFLGRGPEAAEYRRRLTDAYLQRQLRDFNGEPEQAWAAFAAGPDAVREALGRAEAAGGGDWLAYLPAGTQAYVRGRMQGLIAGEGGGRPGMAEAETLALARLAPNADATLRGRVLAEVQRRFSVRLQQRNQEMQRQRAAAVGLLLDNGGDFSALPPALRNTLPARQRRNLLDFGQRLARGEAAATDWGLYYRLQADEAFLGRSYLPAFKDRLSEADYRQISALQASLRQGDTPDARPERDVLFRYLRAAGINPHPAAEDTEGTQAMGRIWSAYAQRLAAARRDSGKPLSEGQVEQVAARLFAMVGVRRGWFGASEKPAVLVDSRKDTVVVPPRDRAQIIEALQAMQPGRSVTEDQVFDQYMRYKGFW